MNHSERPISALVFLVLATLALSACGRVPSSAPLTTGTKNTGGTSQVSQAMNNPGLNSDGSVTPTVPTITTTTTGLGSNSNSTSPVVPHN